jgi:hypothetical protein
MQTFDVSTNILDSQLSFFQKRAGTGKGTQGPALSTGEESVSAVPADPVVKQLPCLRLKTNDLLKLVVTQVVALVILLAVTLGMNVWKLHKIFTAMVLFVLPLLAGRKAEVSRYLLLLLLLHDVLVLLLML